ncbi:MULTISPECIES: preprotein translocase subunit TatA [Halorussus]|uniref:preprotein translocase subunit TatA n=1 Tax=Halorussus TaxID=1070314 RepID=UPI000E2159AE|nr:MULTISPECIES: preprotein translocase subunit TatA [Halorussus]NHN58075.1 preprotein translocase subunit TatA [Halorussus sp. JP-T4]
MVPLQVAVPGGVELLVILLVALIVFGVPVVLAGVGLYLYRQSKSDRPAGEEIESLRREVERLREEINRLDDEK